MRRAAPIRLLLLLLLVCNPVAPLSNAQSSLLDLQLRDALSQLSANHPEQAHQTLEALLRALDNGQPPQAASDPKFRTSVLITDGRALAQLRRYPEALQQYERALESAPAGFDRLTLELVAADTAVRAKQPSKAIQWAQQVIEQAPPGPQRAMAKRLQAAAYLTQSQLPEAWQILQSIDAEYAVGVCDQVNQIGAAALQQAKPQLAADAYLWLTEHADQDALKQKGQLGFAWSAALGARPPREAAALLRGYAEAFPEDPDALRALRAEVACWRQAGEVAETRAALLRLVIATQQAEATAIGRVAIAAIDELSLLDWNAQPIHDTATADHATADHGAADQPERDGSPSPAQPAAARRRLVLHPDVQLDLQGSHLLTVAIIEAAAHDDEPYWTGATSWALRHPASQQIIADTLTRLSATGHDAHAERLAATVLSQLEDPTSQSPVFADACDAVCRWAADSGRWTMLALAAEHADAESATARLTPLSIRLLAESLLQTKRAQAAKQWFDAAVRGGAVDFATLIRAAELSVALDDLETAAARLQAAAAAAGQVDAETTLIEVLRAELAIRRARLDEARSILERIVRLDGTAAAVRCRAQWLIGETYLLQERYSEAIDAYRLVESFDQSAGNWTAAALVQAGKSFEKMGRPRDAATCYGGLLQRFADSEHALVARDRLAVIRADTQRR